MLNLDHRGMDPEQVLAACGGIAHIATLEQRGVTRRMLARAVADEQRVVMLRRQWYALPTASVDQVAAVVAGGQLACVSAAVSRKLWVPDHEGVHVRVAPSSSRRSAATSTGLALRYHYSIQRAPTPLSPVESIEDMLVHVSQCQTYENALCVFDSVQNTHVLARDALLQLGEVIGGRFRELAIESTPLADSGIETLPRVRFARLGIRMTPQVSVDGHSLDGRIGERMYLQFDGYGPHSSRWQREKDLREDARMRLQGHTVFRFLSSQVMHEWPFVEQTVVSAIAQRLHLWPRHDPRRDRTAS